jgi:hypothetical protein
MYKLPFMRKLLLLIILCAFSLYSKGQSYCIPYFGGAYGSCAYYGFHVSSLLLVGAGGNIGDSASCDGSGYLGRTALSCNLNMGGSYNMTVVTPGTYTMSGQVWIDYDNDSTFSSSESVGGFGTASGTHEFTITLPAVSASGTHRMRVLVNDAHYGGAIYPSISPCGGYYYGETRDYSVVLGTAPVGYLAPTSLSFSPTSAGTTSTSMTCVFNGAYLTPASGNLTVTASSNFSVCSTSGGTYASSYTLAYSGAAVSANNIYVKYNAPATSGYYTGTVCVSGGGLSAPVCSSLSGSSVITLGMPAMQEGDFQVYPNPATTELYINTGGGNGAGVCITNSVGAEAMRQPISAGETRLNIKGLPAGVYYIRLTGAGSSVVKKFVKL